MILIRTLRGGSWFYRGDLCRSAYRGGVRLDFLYDHVGFRVREVK